jgi:lysosomal acid lipase/cholesteryl ester hydrolase
MFAITGADTSNLNTTRIEVYECHNPAGTSVKNLVHWAQLIRDQDFKRFDYKEENWKHYGQATPPVYNISSLDVPTVLVMGGEDWLADPQDEIWLMSRIGQVVRKTVVIDYYNHVDFIWGLDAPDKVYRPIIEYLKTLHVAD